MTSRTTRRAGGTYRTRRFSLYIAVAFYVWVGAVVPAFSARGSCLPLALSELQDLDTQTERQPEHAIRGAQGRLAAAHSGIDAFLSAQLLAIIADAQLELSQPNPARAALESARADLQGLPPSRDLARLQLRLNLVEAQLAIMAADNAAAVAATSKLLDGLPPDSLDRACTLSMRATAYDYLRQPDLAVGDALVAYRIAENGNWPNARLEAAGTLARAFGRAGLYPQAEQMIEVVVAIAKTDKKTALMSTVEYERGMLLVRAHRFADARVALEESNVYATQIGDRFAVAASNATLCWALLNENDLDAADRICSTGDADLASGHRADLDTQLIGNRARLDLERGHPRAALTKLNRILTPALHSLLPGSEPQFYWDRARALGQLKRHREANADFVRMHALEAAADNEQRNRQVAVLSAMIASEGLNTANRLLQQRINRQQEDLRRHRARRELWAALSLAALIISALLGYLLWVNRRYSRSLRHDEIILHSAGAHAPDAFMLLDEHRRVRFANRNLCGHGPIHAIGETAGSALPAALAAVVTAAIDEAFQRGSVVSFAVSTADSLGAPRQFEMCVVPAVEHERVLGGTLRAIDVTDRRALEREVVDGASLERQRLSSELHEGLGQQLAGVLLLLSNALNVVRRGLPHVELLLEEIAGFVRQGIETTRELARGLAPVQIGCGSFTIALRSLATDAARLLRVEVECECELADVLLSDLAADHLYRICREAVNNAALHGCCRKVRVVVRIEGDMFAMSICDDGRGMALGRPEPDGLGVKMMGYRARLLGGDCKLTAQSTVGTCVRVTVPLALVGVISRKELLRQTVAPTG